MATTSSLGCHGVLGGWYQPWGRSLDSNIVQLVSQLRAGDPTAREDLVSEVYERLVRLSRKMLRSSSKAVQRWEQTEDLAHAAWFRIQRALQDTDLQLEDDAHFFRLAARHIRFELIDIFRKHTGAHGIAANHQTVSPGDADGPPSDGERFSASETLDPQQLTAWGEFHEIVEKLPERDKEVIDLLWYQGLKQQEAADLIGVDVKTVKRRWRDVKIRLSDQLDSGLIEL